MSPSEEKILQSIHQELELVPAAFLESVLHIIRAIRLHAPVPTPVSVEALQAYADRFRKVLSLLFRKGRKVNVNRIDLENAVCLHFFIVAEEAYSCELGSEEINLEALILDNELNKEAYEQILEEKEELILYDEESYFVIKKQKATLWTADKARLDAKNELDKVLIHLPETNEEI